MKERIKRVIKNIPNSRMPWRLIGIYSLSDMNERKEFYETVESGYCRIFESSEKLYKDIISGRYNDYVICFADRRSGDFNDGDEVFIHLLTPERADNLWHEFEKYEERKEEEV